MRKDILEESFKKNKQFFDKILQKNKGKSIKKIKNKH